MADIADLSFAEELLVADPGLRKARKALAPEQHPDFDGKHCVECAAQIPRARLLLQRVRCVFCQEAAESRARGFATR